MEQQLQSCDGPCVSAGAGGAKQAAIPVQAMTVTFGLLSTDRSTAGVIAPVTQSQVVAQVAGVVAKVPHSVGDWVKAGETVMQLDDAQLRLTLANAEAALENAKISLAVGKDSSSDANPKLSLQLDSAKAALDSATKNYEAQKALFDLGGISASQLDTASSQLATARANFEGAKSAVSQNAKSDDQTIAQLRLAVTVAQNQVDQAALNVRNASIRAPFAGQIAAINPGARQLRVAHGDIRSSDILDCAGFGVAGRSDTARNWLSDRSPRSAPVNSWADGGRSIQRGIVGDRRRHSSFFPTHSSAREIVPTGQTHEQKAFRATKEPTIAASKMVSPAGCTSSH